MQFALRRQALAYSRQVSRSKSGARRASLGKRVVPLRRSDPSGLASRSAALSKSKRAIDIIVSLLLIVALFPLFILVSIAIKIDSRGPVIFKQWRSGLLGRKFLILKFRTMFVCENGPTVNHVTKRDRRVTRMGRLLRATSIDELPQLFNVLMGDMSLIGPRPHALAHDETYGEQISQYRWRYRTRPGLTGLAQIRGLRGEILTLDCMKKRIAADCEYVEHWSLTLDLVIAVKTLPLIIRDSRAY